MKKCFYLLYFVFTSIVLSAQTNNKFQYTINDCCVEISVSSIYMASCPNWYFQIGDAIYNSTTSPAGIINHCFSSNGNFTAGIVGCGEFLAVNFNITTCTSKICAKVNDPTGKCPNGVSGVTVSIKDNEGNIVCTGTTVNGQFCCDVPKNKFPLTVCSKVNCGLDPNTLSTLDLVIIKNVILGLTPNVPPNFMIWADANGDGIVSAQDLLILRKIILGIDVTTNLCRVMSKKCVETIDNYPTGVFKDYSLCYSGCELISNSGNQTIEFNIYDIGDVNLSSMDVDCTKPLIDESLESRTTIKVNSLSIFYVQESDKILVTGLETDNLNIKDESIRLKISSISGQVLLNRQVSIEYDSSLIDVPIDLPLGIYVASLYYKDEIVNVKFIKK